MKTDLYTKIVLTVIAVFLAVIIIKDVDFVSKAQASPVNLDLSALNVEKAEGAEENEMTFFIYENSKIERPFSKSLYYDECYINYNDVPTYIITNLKPHRNRNINIKINK
ncbi:hypothetical protein [Prevotella sp. 10(H)]|uniref:hypothetical protein n=1 Tax=Prevotella sp. 10(H) TaxID=1158294 RepID=UPI0004A70565|nr:hypothetical protein [Prevotella sp. 10(H)]